MEDRYYSSVVLVINMSLRVEILELVTCSGVSQLNINEFDFCKGQSHNMIFWGLMSILTLSSVMYITYGLKVYTSSMNW